MIKTNDFNKVAGYKKKKKKEVCVQINCISTYQQQIVRN